MNGEGSSRRAVLLIAPLFLACGLGQGPALEGSLSELVDLHYDSADVQASATELALRFIRPHGSGEDVVLKVTASLQSLTLTAGQELPLSQKVTGGVQRGVLSRNVFNDPRRSFPELERGMLKLRELPDEPGKTVRGEFSATFVEGVEFGSGRTVYARTFEAKVP